MMDIFLVKDKEKKPISAIKGIDENGELQIVPIKQEVKQIVVDEMERIKNDPKLQHLVKSRIIPKLFH